MDFSTFNLLEKKKLPYVLSHFHLFLSRVNALFKNIQFLYPHHNYARFNVNDYTSVVFNARFLTCQASHHFMGLPLCSVSDKQGRCSTTSAFSFPNSGSFLFQLIICLFDFSENESTLASLFINLLVGVLGTELKTSAMLSMSPPMIYNLCLLAFWLCWCHCCGFVMLSFWSGFEASFCFIA